MNYLHWIASCLADAILTGSFTKDAIHYHISETLAEQPLWIDKLCRYLVKKASKDPALQNKATLVHTIANFIPFAEACRQQKIVIRNMAAVCANPVEFTRRNSATTLHCLDLKCRPWLL